MSDILQMSPYYALLPELILVVGAMALLMVGASVGQSSTDFVTGCAIFLLLVVCLLIAEMPSEKLVLFNGSFVLDGFGRYMKILSLIGSGVTILMSIGYLELPSRRTYEYVVLILLATAGMMILISAGDLIALYLGLELMSLSLYVVAAIDRDNVRSTEAGLKYFVLGALSSGMLLYGASLVYGFTGTVSFAGIAAAA